MKSDGDIQKSVATTLDAWQLRQTAAAMELLARRFNALAKDNDLKVAAAQKANTPGGHVAIVELKAEAGAYRHCATMALAEEEALARAAAAAELSA